MGKLLSLAQEGEGLHVRDITIEIFKKLGLEYRGTYTIGQLIEKGRDYDFQIVRIKGIDFDSNVDPLVYNLTKDFEKKFFGGVMFDDEEKRKSYAEITKIIDEEFLLDEMEMRTSKSTADSFLYIKGLPINTDAKLYIPREEILAILIPY